MQALTPDAQQMVNAMASRHNFSSDAVYQLLLALAAGGGRQAQFNHPELGGMGQWSQGGMIMVGDMFNQTLKYRVDTLCNDLAGALGASSPFNPTLAASPAAGVSLFVLGGFDHRWPAELGAPSTTGSQNNLHYAVFPATRRLAIEQAGQVTVYDTTDHQIGGVSQQQSGDQSLNFTSQHGLVRLQDLPVVALASPQSAPAAADFPETRPRSTAPEQPISAPAPIAPPARPGNSDDEIFSRIERLAELRQKDILTEAEFAAKKAELLARL